jgi:hypothetical protein
MKDATKRDDELHSAVRTLIFLMWALAWNLTDFRMSLIFAVAASIAYVLWAAAVARLP